MLPLFEAWYQFLNKHAALGDVVDVTEMLLNNSTGPRKAQDSAGKPSTSTNCNATNYHKRVHQMFTRAKQQVIHSG